jgi:FixJ family two-component response regulator
MNQSRKPKRRVTPKDEGMARRHARGRVMLVDDDPGILLAYARLLELEGYACESFASAVALLEELAAGKARYPGPACILCDVDMPEITGLELQQRLRLAADMPIVLMSGASAEHEVVQGFRGGAVDFLLKPIDIDELLRAVAKALALSAGHRARERERRALEETFATLNARERTVMERIALGETNQTIAGELGVSLRSVKLYRQHVMEKTGARNLPELVRMIDTMAGRGG